MARSVLRTDGGARGNPGPAGAGFVIEVDGSRVCGAGRYLGETTNNVAEYEALIWGLENVVTLGVTELTVFADSELVVKQINGSYKVKNANLKPLFARVMELMRGVGKVEVRHVRREENVAADEMANAAMDARGVVGDPVCAPGCGPEQGALF